MTSVRRYAAAPIGLLAILVAVGVWVQVYLAASYIFGADAIDIHKDVGWAIHTIELLIFLLALIAWTDKRRIWMGLGLAVLGTVQITFSEGEDWVAGFHGMLALAVLTLAVFIVKTPAAAPPPSAVQPD